MPLNQIVRTTLTVALLSFGSAEAFSQQIVVVRGPYLLTWEEELSSERSHLVAHTVETTARENAAHKIIKLDADCEDKACLDKAVKSLKADDGIWVKVEESTGIFTIEIATTTRSLNGEWTGTFSGAIQEVARLTRGSVFGETGPMVERVEADSREDVEGALFVALKGERFDGHDFLCDVAKRGAAAVLVENQVSQLSIPQVVVKSSLLSLASLGLARRSQLNGPLMAITGSSGKTTTRRLLASIASTRYRTHQPIRNFNNHIGVPLTLLALEDEHEAAVVELGCSDFGEIEYLTRHTDPDVGLVTNVGPAHLERLGDLEGVARAKGELFSAMREDAVAVVNLDDPRVTGMSIVANGQISYGDGPDAEARLLERRPAGARGQEIVLELCEERVMAALPLIGAHNATNALAAIAVAQRFGFDQADAAEALADFAPAEMRLQRVKIGKVAVINDAYNANPASVAAAASVLAETPAKRRVMVLGDMRELGDQAEQLHRELGAQLARGPMDLLIGVGALGRYIAQGAAEAGVEALQCETVADAEQELVSLLKSGDVVLIKGSRAMAMERLIEPIRQAFA